MEDFKHLPIDCNIIQKLLLHKNINILAGEKGLYRVVEWVHYIEDPNYVNCAKEGELIITANLHLRPVDDVVMFIEKLIKLKTSAIIIYKNHSGEIPYKKEIVDIGNSYNFPIFTLPYKVLLAEITQTIYEEIFSSKIAQNSLDKFIKSLISDEITINEELITKAYELGYIEHKYYFCTIIRCYDKNYGLDYNYNLLKIKIANIINLIEIKYNLKILYSIDNSMVILLIPENNNENCCLMTKIVEDLVCFLNEHLPKLKISVGISELCENLLNFKKFHKQALNISALAQYFNKNILYYRDQEIYKLLFEIKDLEIIKSIENDFIGKLKKQDDNLIESLFTLVEFNYDLEKTSDFLHVHINTLRYRIKKIEDMLNIKIRDPQNIFRIYLIYYLNRYKKFKNSVN